MQTYHILCMKLPFDYDLYEFPFANSSDLPQQHRAKLVKTLGFLLKIRRTKEIFKIKIRRK